MLSLGLMAASCSDENKEIMVEEPVNNQLESYYLPRSSGSLWTPGETVSFAFLGDADASQKQWVRECVNELMAYANINFEETDDEEDADVRIKIDNKNNGMLEFKKCTDCIGKHNTLSLYYECSTISIYTKELGPNITKAQKSAFQLKFKGAVLHNLCHILGLGDEIHNPNARISFNKNNMISWLNSQSSQIDAEYCKMVYDEEFGDKYKQSMQKSVYTAFDVNSIMMIPIPSSWTNNGKSYSANYTLSTNDIAKLKELYPYPTGMVPLYVGSDSKFDGMIGTYDEFADKTKIREMVGYGYRKSGTDYRYYTCPVVTTPVWRFSNSLTGEAKYDKKVTKCLTFVNSTGNGTMEGGWSFVWKYDLCDKEGDGRNPIVQYYNYSTKRYAFSGAKGVDKYLIARGYQMQGVFAATLKKADNKYALTKR